VAPSPENSTPHLSRGRETFTDPDGKYLKATVAVNGSTVTKMCYRRSSK
jgi:hypothetical protein